MIFSRNYFVYIATNKNNRVLYTGVTNNIYNRGWQHKEKIHPDSFTAKYNINKIVYYETYSDIRDALVREKQIKNYSRQKKLDLVNGLNPKWESLT